MAAALLRSLLLGTITPPYQSSDEHWHLDYARVLAQGHVPEYGKAIVAPEIIDHDRQASAERNLTLYGVLREDMPNIEAIQPPFGYVAPAAGYRVTDSPQDALFAFRLSNALMGALAAVVAYLFMGGAFPTRRWAGPMAGITAVCSPPVAMVASTANNDATLAVVAVVAIGVAATLARGGGSIRRWVLLGALIGASVLVKTSGLLLFAPAVLASLVAPSDDGENSHRETILKRIATVVLVAVAIDLPWAVHNEIVYGNPIDPRVLFPGKWSKLLGPFWVDLGRGAVGVLRWTDLFLPMIVYVAGGLLAVFALVAVVRWIDREATGPDRRAAAVVVTSFLAFIAGVIWYSFRIDYQPQGRYLVPGLIVMGGLVGAASERRGFLVGAGALAGLLVVAVGTSLASFGSPL